MTARLLVARHAEARCNADQVVNADPRRECDLTPIGVSQAKKLGERLSVTPIELCVTTEFPRTQQTAAVALEGRAVKTVVVADLNDPRQPVYEGRPVAEYLEWQRVAAIDEAPDDGGESQIDAVRRYLRGWRRVLKLQPKTVLVVAHDFPIAVARTLCEEDPPVLRARYEKRVDLAELYELEVSALNAGLDLLEGELSARQGRASAPRS